MNDHRRVKVTDKVCKYNMNIKIGRHQKIDTEADGSFERCRPP